MKTTTNQTSTGARDTGAFSLIELLMVISIMGLIAAMTIGAVKVASASRDRSATTTQLAKLIAAIESYKSKYGTYPPDCVLNAALNPERNPLAYELGGVHISGGNFVADADPNHIVTPAMMSSVFPVPAPGQPGFVNAAPNTATKPRYVLPLQVGTSKTADIAMIDFTGTGPMMFLRVPADHPLANTTVPINTWRYRAYPAAGHNPKSYDLWAEIKQSGGGTNIIGNWTK